MLRLAAPLLIVVACTSATEPTVSLDQPFDLRFQESVVVGSELQVTFAEVREDSRCPRSVQCVWEGNAQIALAVRADGRTATVLLNTAGRPGFPGEAQALGYVVRLRELRPYPETTDKIDPQRYVAALTVSR